MFCHGRSHILLFLLLLHVHICYRAWLSNTEECTGQQSMSNIKQFTVHYIMAKCIYSVCTRFVQLTFMTLSSLCTRADPVCPLSWSRVWRNGMLIMGCPRNDSCPISWLSSVCSRSCRLLLSCMCALTWQYYSLSLYMYINLVIFNCVVL